jgi:hypothetical protein
LYANALQPLLFLPLPPLRFLQILQNIPTPPPLRSISVEERLRLGGVVRLSRGEERRLELLLVNVEAEGDERVYDFFDEGLIDGGGVALGGDEAQDGGGEWGLEACEEVLAPLGQGELR